MQFTGTEVLSLASLEDCGSFDLSRKTSRLLLAVPLMRGPPLQDSYCYSVVFVSAAFGFS